MRVLMKLTARAAKGHGQNVSEPSSENQLKAAASWPAATHNSQLALKLATMPQQQQHQQQQTKNEFSICPPQLPTKCSWPFLLLRLFALAILFCLFALAILFCLFAFLALGAI